MTKLSTLKNKWLKEPKVKSAYDAMQSEYDIAKQLITERLKAKLTQKDVAKKMKTTQSVVARFESGAQRPSLKTIQSYAKALGKTVEIRFKSRRSKG